MPDLFSSLESKYNIRMGSGLAMVKNAKEPYVDTSEAETPPTKIKVKKKKIVRKQSTEPNAVSVETSTTTSTSSVFGMLCAN